MKLDYQTGVERAAVISECGSYRYRLARTWDRTLPHCAYIMLNPSTADHREDDPTIRRCLSFARREGFGRIEVVNLFAFRSAYPSSLRATKEPIGPLNDETIADVCRGAGKIIFAWGGIHKRWHGRAQQVSRAIWAAQPDGEHTWCLGVTDAGQPRHPLMLPADAELRIFP